MLILMALLSRSQTAGLKGTLKGPEGPVMFANIALYQSSDSNLVKVQTSDEAGQFQIMGLSAGKYDLVATYVGLSPLRIDDLKIEQGKTSDLGEQKMTTAATDLEAAVVKGRRAMVEVKPDRTVFNVEGTINATGTDGIELLRKAPGVLIDNNNNISVLGRQGVRVFINGKRLPLEGEELSNYLQNLSADQISSIDIISSPGAKYEAEGNAGIIDIKLKKSDDVGANGRIGTTLSHGKYLKARLNAGGNFKNRDMNIYGNFSAADNERFNRMEFDNFQNGLFVDEVNRMVNNSNNYSAQVGMDYSLSDKHTVGFIVNQNYTDRISDSRNFSQISDQTTITSIDSVLVADSRGERQNYSGTYNVNYRFNQDKTSLNLDLDYGQFRINNINDQPNLYFDSKREELLSTANTYFETETDIDILTFKADYERQLLGGSLGLGTKLSQVVTDNLFKFYNVPDEELILNELRSNEFEYNERVFATYISYQRKLSEKVSISAGLRSETTDATGELMPFLEDLQEPPVEQDYTNFFPTAGLSYQLSMGNTLSINYGRRINRPDYNVLNPFEQQLSELSFRKGNPFLIPEIVNNMELGYTYKFRYNFKLAYSKTTDQITRLISPDDKDPRAGSITWENLSEQTVYSANASLPFGLADFWDVYLNLNASYIDNQADYGNGAVVDVQAFSYNFFLQNTFKLPRGFTGEISGWYSGPGIWGGVFEYDPSWSLNLGIQKRFLNDHLLVKLSGNDLFYQAFWSGTSEFNGLISSGKGGWDSRRATLSINYNFGNDKIKTSKRKTGIEEESKRVSSDN